MDTYSILRAFADSWFLIGMFCFFLGTVIWALWPSQAAARQAAAFIPLKDEPTGDSRTGADCACTTKPGEEKANG